jgi:hypothetical protein
MIWSTTVSVLSIKLSCTVISNMGRGHRGGRASADLVAGSLSGSHFTSDAYEGRSFGVLGHGAVGNRAEQ